MPTQRRHYKKGETCFAAACAIDCTSNSGATLLSLFGSQENQEKIIALTEFDVATNSPTFCNENAIRKIIFGSYL
jgi:hypothetical protein